MEKLAFETHPNHKANIAYVIQVFNRSRIYLSRHWSMWYKLSVRLVLCTADSCTTTTTACALFKLDFCKSSSLGRPADTSTGLWNYSVQSQTLSHFGHAQVGLHAITVSGSHLLDQKKATEYSYAHYKDWP